MPVSNYFRYLVAGVMSWFDSCVLPPCRLLEHRTLPPGSVPELVVFGTSPIAFLEI